MSVQRPKFDQISLLLAYTLTITTALYTVLTAAGGGPDDIAAFTGLFGTVATLVTAAMLRP